MSGIEAIIFDCDGVLFESQGANIAYYDSILRQLSYPALERGNSELIHLCHTASSTDVIKALVRPEDEAAANRYAAELDYRQFIPYMQPEPHLASTLATLHPRYPLAVATNRGRSVIPILEHFAFDRYFTTVVTSHDVARPKPAPDMLLLAAEQLAVNRERCLFVGDSELDRMAAEEAAMPFVGYGLKSGGERQLNSHLDLIEILL